MRKPAPPTSRQAWFCVIAALIAPFLSIYQKVGEMATATTGNTETRAIAMHLRDNDLSGIHDDIRELREKLWTCTHPDPRKP